MSPSQALSLPDGDPYAQKSHLSSLPTPCSTSVGWGSVGDWGQTDLGFNWKSTTSHMQGCSTIQLISQVSARSAVRWKKIMPILQGRRKFQMRPRLPPSRYSAMEGNAIAVITDNSFSCHQYINAYIWSLKMVTMTLYARQQKRRRYKEQTFGLCGRKRGWE